MKVSSGALVGSVVLMAAALAGCSVASTGPIPTVFVTLSPSAVPTPTDTGTATYGYTEGDQWDMTAADGAMGSGCSPGTSLLPDGAWFGFANAWSTSSITFDLACHYVGAAADAVAADRGEEATDFYITNDKTTVRIESVGAGAFGHKASTDDGAFPLADIIADPGGSLPTASPYPVWLFVNRGVVTEVTVQYLP